MKEELVDLREDAQPALRQARKVRPIHLEDVYGGAVVRWAGTRTAEHCRLVHLFRARRLVTGHERFHKVEAGIVGSRTTSAVCPLTELALLMVVALVELQGPNRYPNR